jgi:hypothetical protein
MFLAYMAITSVVWKLLCSFFLCGPLYVLVYPSVMGHCLCVLL